MRPIAPTTRNFWNRCVSVHTRRAGRTQVSVDCMRNEPPFGHRTDGGAHDGSRASLAHQRYHDDSGSEPGPGAPMRPLAPDLGTGRKTDRDRAMLGPGEWCTAAAAGSISGARARRSGARFFAEAELFDQVVIPFLQ